jgi:hypothetical protein
MKQCKKVNTHIAAIDSTLPSLAKLKLHAGEDTVEAYIEMWILNLLSFINVGKTMNDDQVHQTAMMIVEEYPSLNLSDINLVFKMAKLGKMGPFYDRLDGQVILSWFQKYYQERCSIAAERSINEAAKYKGDNISSFDKVVALYQKNKYW